MKINPKIKEMIIFSGGGALVYRELDNLAIKKGENVFAIEQVPSSFDDNTIVVDLKDNKSSKLVQVIVKKPDKNFIEKAINRERDASNEILAQGIDIRQELRQELVDICEGLRSYTYNDSFSEFTIIIDSAEDEIISIKIAYFVADKRLVWIPNLQIDIDESEKTATLNGQILVDNQINNNFENIELNFVEFDGIDRVNNELDGLIPNIQNFANFNEAQEVNAYSQGQVQQKLNKNLRAMKKLM